ncbi:MAG: hypothetical protein JO264_01490 [Acidisphaera sp.]|nr:hypothetical protein [Acidisphaera sp.]
MAAETLAPPVKVAVPEGHRLLHGDALGKTTRQELHLDDLDRSPEHVVVRIATPVVTSSFIRAFVGPSVRTLGYEGFIEKYQFDATRTVRESILSNARYARDDNDG